MSTRGTIKFKSVYDEEETEYCTLYNQWDSYISGLGHELADWLLTLTMVNGIPVGDNSKKYVNGFDDLITQYIAEFKDGAGGLYMTTSDNKQEYNYHLIFDSKKYYDWSFGKQTPIDDLIKIEVYDWNDKQIFNGTPSELLNYEESWEDEE